MHESSLASLFHSFGNLFFPYKVEDNFLTDHITDLFPEFEQRYGRNVKMSADVTLVPKDPDFIHISKTKGIQIGKNNGLEIQLNLYCQNKTIRNPELAVEFVMDFEVDFTASIEDQFAHLVIKNAKVSNTKIVNNHIKMVEPDSGDFFQAIVDYTKNKINDMFIKPYDLNLQNEYVQFIYMVVQKFRVSHTMQDEFLYLGFTYFLDDPNDNVWDN